MLASAADVAARLGRELTAEETARVDGLLAEASALAEAVMQCTPDPVPVQVAVVVSRMVARVLDSKPSSMGANAVQQTAGPFAFQTTFSEGANSGGPWLTRGDRLILRRHGCGRRAASFPTW